jgi:NADP-dependent 3-hydroxy acid dehydrogenase YdfG
VTSNNIEGNVIVITGASSGLGEATARLLSAQGARVVLGARRLDRIESLSGDLSARGGEALAVGTAVRDFDQGKRLVDTAVQTYGRIDVMLTMGRRSSYNLQSRDR